MGDVIRQTNRTMLMEEVNPEKLDFLTLVGDTRGVESLSDDKITSTCWYAALTKCWTSLPLWCTATLTPTTRRWLIP